MYRLGLRFLVEYYRVILSNKTSIVLCADAAGDGIVGLVSVTLRPEKELEAMRKRRLRFLLAVLPAIIRRPALIEAVYLRNRSLSAKFLGEGFLSHSCPRIAYWGWSPDYPSYGKSMTLLTEIMRLVREIGENRLQLEVDRINRKVEVTHRLLGAKVVREFTTSDGRERIIMEYEFHALGTQA